MNKKLLMYGGFGIAVLVYIAMTFGLIDPAVATPIMGVCGFSGIAALRSFINSTGIKTKLGYSGAFLSIGVYLVCEFTSLDFMSVELLQKILLLLTNLSGITLAQAKSKE